MDKKHQHFLKLLKPIEVSVQAYAKHLAWSRNDVEDIFQTALLNALKKFDTYENGTNFKAWFFQFVTYAAFNANRQHEKISARELAVEPDHIADFGQGGVSFEQDLRPEEIIKDPDNVLANIDEEIRRAIKRLSVRRRSVFLLKAVADLSYMEISQVLDIPIGTVMGELYRSREQLREDLDVYARRTGVLKRDGDSHEL